MKMRFLLCQKSSYIFLTISTLLLKTFKCDLDFHKKNRIFVLEIQREQIALLFPLFLPQKIKKKH